MWDRIKLDIISICTLEVREDETHLAYGVAFDKVNLGLEGDSYVLFLQMEAVMVTIKSSCSSYSLAPYCEYCIQL